MNRGWFETSLSYNVKDIHYWTIFSMKIEKKLKIILEFWGIGVIGSP
jgi:hypothetical protein